MVRERDASGQAGPSGAGQDLGIVRAAQALAQQRRRVVSKCEQCGREIEGIRAKRFCSSACRMRASRARQSQHWASPQAIAQELDVLGEAVERLLELIDQAPGHRSLRAEALQLRIHVDILRRQHREGRESIHVVRGA